MSVAAAGWLSQTWPFVGMALFAGITWYFARRMGLSAAQRQLIATLKDLVAAYEQEKTDLGRRLDDAKAEIQTLQAAYHKKIGELEERLRKANAQVDTLVDILERRRANGDLAEISDQRKRRRAGDGTAA